MHSLHSHCIAVHCVYYFLLGRAFPSYRIRHHSLHQILHSRHPCCCHCSALRRLAIANFRASCLVAVACHTVGMLFTTRINLTTLCTVVSTSVETCLRTICNAVEATNTHRPYTGVAGAVRINQTGFCVVTSPFTNVATTIYTRFFQSLAILLVVTAADTFCVVASHQLSSSQSECTKHLMPSAHPGQP